MMRTAASAIADSIPSPTVGGAGAVLAYEPAAPPAGTYAWAVVAMLWMVCLFNYADRQAIFSVFPLLKSQMHLSDVQLGIVGSAFMWVYAAALPFAGMVGDRLPRKTLIVGGLLFWSLITLATALSTRFSHLVIFRALEGLGEAFYFPASMSMISDYHSVRSRSRAMSLHQSSVYAGTIVGGTAAGFFGQYYGWRSGFYVFGALGIALAIVLMWTLKEPVRGQSDATAVDAVRARPDREPSFAGAAQVLRTPMVLMLIAVFIGANFVAAIFLTWMPSFLNRKFAMSLSMAGLNATAWLQIASVIGVIGGGIVGDRYARHYRGGRMMTQAIGLILGVPFLFLTGWSLSVSILVVGMIGFGFFKGLYDANLWASLYDVVKTHRRATAVGLMNSIGWIVGGIAPVAIAAAAQRWGMSACLSATSLVYLAAGFVMIAAVYRHRKQPLGAQQVVKP